MIMKFRAIWQSFFLVVLVGYMFVWIMLPTKTYKNSWAPKLNNKLNSTYFREQGTNLVLFTFPLMLISVLGCVYLHLQKESSSQSGKSFYGGLRRPMMVMAPLGIVSAVELTFLAMFFVLMIWSLGNYLYVSFGHLHMHTAGEKVWEAKFRSVFLRLGYIGHICWAFLFFPVTRGSSILPLLGISSESSIKYHIWLGHISTFLFAAHSVGFIIYWWTMTQQMYLMLEWSSTYLSNVAGVIAFVVSLVIWGTSLGRVRRKMFELFFYTHHLYIVYLVFYMLHVGVGYLCMILPGIFLFLIDRYLRFLQSRRQTRLESARLLPNGTMELTFAKNPGLSYGASSTLFLHVPSVCKLQWHPFTVISNGELEREKLSVVIKSQGSWTKKLYKQLSSNSLGHLQVSTEGPYGPASSHYLRRECLVMISGGSGITPFFSIIRQIIAKTRAEESNASTMLIPSILLVSAFKTTADLTMLDLLLPSDISKLQIQIEAYVTQERHEKPLDHTENRIETKVFKPDPSDSHISAVLGENSWLWLGGIISSSFVLFLLLLGFVTRYHIYPVEKRGEKYHYSYKILWDIFLVCVCVFVGTSGVVLWQKWKMKQIQNLDLSCSVSDADVESLTHHHSLAQSTKVHFGARPDLKRIVLDYKESEVGVLVCGPKSMRHEVAKICASHSPKNLYFESISFNW